MKNKKLFFALITLTALILTVYSGTYLKSNADQLSKGLGLAWGAVFVASALTVVRGIKYLGRK